MKSVTCLSKFVGAKSSGRKGRKGYNEFWANYF